MPLYSRSTRLKDVIFACPQVIPVVNRLGIRLGVGDYTIEKACRQHGVDPDFLLLIVNTFVNEDYFPEDTEAHQWREKTTRYLNMTDRYYAYVQLPNIERHLNSLVEKSNVRDHNLSLLLGFFLEAKKELLAAINCSGPEKARLQANMSVEEKIDDLLSFFVVHLSGNYDNNLCMAVVSALFSLRKDIRQNNRLRSRLLGGLSEKNESDG